MYDIGVNDTRYRSKVKKKIQQTFPDQLLFLTAKLNTPEVVLSAKHVASHTLSNKEAGIIYAAESLREDILKYSKELPKPSWPQTIGQNSLPEREIPEYVRLFCTELLKSEKQHFQKQ